MSSFHFLKCYDIVKVQEKQEGGEVVVSGKNAVGSNQTVAYNAKRTNVSKNSKTQKYNEFSSMMDKQVQNDTAKPQKSQHTEDGKDPQQNEPTTVQKEEKAPESELDVQVLAQQFVVLPEQERAGLNWGNPIAAEATVTNAAEAVQTATAKADAPGQATLQTTVGAEDVSAQTKTDLSTTSDLSTKADAPKQTQPKISEKAENTVKQAASPEVQKEKTETVQTVKDEFVLTGKKVLGNEEALQGKELVWQKDMVREDAVQQKDIPKAKTDETLLKFKVGESVDLSGKNATKDLADKILVRSLGKDNNTFEIQLKPQELGSIKVKLVFEHGKVNVAMFCENQKAAEILSASSGKLSELIESRTGDQTNVLVQQKEENIFRDGEQKENHNQQSEQEQKKQNRDERNDGEILDFVQQMRLGLAGMQSII